MKTKPLKPKFIAPMKCPRKKGTGKKALIDAPAVRPINARSEDEWDCLQIIDDRRPWCCPLPAHQYNKEYRLIWAPTKMFFSKSSQARELLANTKVCEVGWVGFSDIAQSAHLLLEYEKSKDRPSTPLKILQKTRECIADNTLIEIPNLNGTTFTINDEGVLRKYTFEG